MYVVVCTEMCHSVYLTLPPAKIIGPTSYDRDFLKDININSYKYLYIQCKLLRKP